METRPEHGIDELIAELAQARERVEAIYSKLRHARDTTLPRIGRTDDSALVVAGYLETYYTALETFFVRVSGYFENDLPPGGWHASLLEKMNLEMEYDWARIDFLLATLDGAHPAVLKDLGAFGAFLREVRGRTSPE